MYYALWPRLLDLLKEDFIRNARISEEDFDCDKSDDKHRKNYTLKDYRYNLFQEGCTEKPEEIAYIASRKALNFNVFGKDTVTYRKNRVEITPGSYSIQYKQRIPLINKKNTTILLDTILDGGEEMEIVRTRFFEWIVLKNRLIKESFLHADTYYDREAGEVFAPVIKNILSMYVADGGEFQAVFDSIDSLYIMKELVAAYNIINNCIHTRKEPIKRLNIIECYWKPTNFEELGPYAARVYVKEKKLREEKEYLKFMIKPVLELFEKKFGITVDIKFIDIYEMVFAMEKAANKAVWMYRYMI